MPLCRRKIEKSLIKREKHVDMKSGMAERTYIAIDLKSFYASVECTERGLDPLKTNLVVADAGRTEKPLSGSLALLKGLWHSGESQAF